MQHGYLNTSSLGKYEVFTFFDAATGEKFSVIPAYGANISELVLAKNGRLYSVLDGYKSESDVDKNDWSKGNRLIPFPNRIRDGRYSFEGQEYQLPINEPERHNAIHGFIFNRAFTVDRHTQSDEGISIELSHHYSGDYPGYPFPFEVKVTYSLKRNHGLVVEVQAKNTGQTPMPFGDGWHPYFRLNSPIEQLELQIPSTEALELDAQMIPTGRINPFAKFREFSPIGDTVLDTVFRLSGQGDRAVAEIRDPAEKVVLQIWQETGPGKYNFMVAFTPPQRQSVAIEPMTCSTNAFNSGDGLLVLKPGETFLARHGVNVQ